ncbi:hypothetical protein [Halobacillus karajensis]|uniref:hypothetical protein n=1 Tax=Halobacillus karajensis TaxID=195088 RepID=UPI00045CB89E|nr:hypothetical protein [Halobacillus karajensis]CDQ17955.1 hypothetical protein BN982_00195 [Halobacillus karajensis]
MNNNIPKPIKKYLYKDRFFELVISTSKWKDIFFSKEAFVSLCISLGLSCLISYPFHKLNFTNILNPLSVTNDELNSILEIASTLIPVILGGLFAVLGLTIGGLAIVVGTISDRLIITIVEKEAFDELVSVIFNYYFSGGVIGLTIVLNFFVAILIKISLPFSYFWFMALTFILCYLIIFSLTYSVMLLGTSMRIFFLKSRYNFK